MRHAERRADAASMSRAASVKSCRTRWDGDLEVGLRDHGPGKSTVAEIGQPNPRMGGGLMGERCQAADLAPSVVGGTGQRSLNGDVDVDGRLGFQETHDSFVRGLGPTQ